jgi:twitching motility two-component system response regulator PilG
MRGTQRGFRNGSDVSFQALGMDWSNRANQTVPVSATTGVDTVSIPSSGLKVLVIDDSNTIRRSAEIFLKQGGHDVMLAEDGFDALSKVNDYEPDLIFCDILMPRLDGYQTCAIIKRNARFSDVPIVMLSSKDGVFDKARGRMVGSQDYLTKPFTKDQLLQTVLALGTVKQREE